LAGGEQSENPSVLFLFQSSPCLCHSLLYNLIAN
jgi:hypothetical protein